MVAESVVLNSVCFNPTPGARASLKVRGGGRESSVLRHPLLQVSSFSIAAV